MFCPKQSFLLAKYINNTTAYMLFSFKPKPYRYELIKKYIHYLAHSWLRRNLLGIHSCNLLFRWYKNHSDREMISRSHLVHLNSKNRSYSAFPLILDVNMYTLIYICCYRIRYLTLQQVCI